MRARTKDFERRHALRCSAAVGHNAAYHDIHWSHYRRSARKAPLLNDEREPFAGAVSAGVTCRPGDEHTPFVRGTTGCGRVQSSRCRRVIVSARLRCLIGSSVVSFQVMDLSERCLGCHRKRFLGPPFMVVLWLFLRWSSNSGAAAIRLQDDGGYVDLVVAVHEALPVELELVEQLKVR
ncbi:hypothetical protein HPB51_024825 [Rhipicephalus microplus]|uniref:Uncharacterized protein n=1 Tax=Rhipicephalus microplus TaxID=6941 RepID=A0A9J6F9F5_RHIMP|nr:hypothetical protein HPB51_024825 [Rhipicephalus microplus]